MSNKKTADDPALIHDSLKKLIVRISRLKPDPENVRTHSARNIDSIKASLEKFNQRTPLVVQKQGMIVRKGNGTLQAAKEMGWKTIAALIVDEGDVEATAYALADNRSAELADWDIVGLDRTLGLLKDDEVYKDVTGFTDDEIAMITNQAKFITDDIPDDDPDAWKKEWEGMPEYDQPKVECYKEIIVRFDTKDDYDDFAKLIRQKLTEKTKSIWHPKKAGKKIDQGYVEE